MPIDLAWWAAIAVLLIGNVWLVLRAPRGPTGGRGVFKAPPEYNLVPELVAFPTAVSVRQSPIILVAILGLIMVSALFKARSAESANRVDYLPASLLLACVVLTYWQGPIRKAVPILIAIVILASLARSVSRQVAYSSLLAGMPLFLVANIAGWIAGIRAPGAGVRIGGEYTSSSLFSERVLFPFGTSINAPSYVAAAVIVALIATLRIRQWPHWYQWVGAAAGLFVIVGSNSRTALIVAAAVAILLVITPKALQMVAPYAVGVGLLFPFLLAPMRPVIEWMAGGVSNSSYLSRGGSTNDILDFEGRQEIWSGAIRFLSGHVHDTFHRLFGYGLNGHMPSGAYLFFPKRISAFLSDRSALTAHNSILQMLLDGGIVGAGCLLAVVILTVYRYGRTVELLPIFAVALIIGWSGFTEASLTPGIEHVPIYLLLYLAFFIPLRRRPGSTDVPERAAEPTVART